MRPRRVLAVAPDLFFAARIAEVARATGVALESCDAAALPERARVLRPDLVLVDLAQGAAPLEAARALKATPETAGIRVVGFYAHVEQAVREAALAAGMDEVLPRSAFTRRLSTILAGD